MLAVEVLLGTPTPPDTIRLYIPGELPGQKKVFRSEVVLYVSANNPGAAAVAKDLCSGTGNAFTVSFTPDFRVQYLSKAALSPVQSESWQNSDASVGAACCKRRSS